MNLFVIGDRQTVLGFRLVGIHGTVATEREAAVAALRSALQAERIGVILVTEAVAAQIRDEIDARLYGLGLPLLLEVPDASGPYPGRLSVEDAVRKAIGIRI